MHILYFNDFLNIQISITHSVLLGWPHSCLRFYHHGDTVGGNEWTLEVDIRTRSCPPSRWAHPYTSCCFRTNVIRSWIRTISLCARLYEMPLLRICWKENIWKVSYMIVMTKQGRIGLGSAFRIKKWDFTSRGNIFKPFDSGFCPFGALCCNCLIAYLLWLCA